MPKRASKRAREPTGDRASGKRTTTRERPRDSAGRFLPANPSDVPARAPPKRDSAGRFVSAKPKATPKPIAKRDGAGRFATDLSPKDARNQRLRERYAQLKDMGYSPEEARRYKHTPFFTDPRTETYDKAEKQRLYEEGREVRRAVLETGKYRQEALRLDYPERYQRWAEFSGSDDGKHSLNKLADALERIMLASGIDPDYARQNKYRFAYQYFVERGFEVDELQRATSSFEAENVYFGGEAEGDDLPPTSMALA